MTCLLFVSRELRVNAIPPFSTINLLFCERSMVFRFEFEQIENFNWLLDLIAVIIPLWVELLRLFWYRDLMRGWLVVRSNCRVDILPAESATMRVD